VQCLNWIFGFWSRKKKVGYLQAYEFRMQGFGILLVKNTLPKFADLFEKFMKHMHKVYMKKIYVFNSQAMNNVLINTNWKTFESYMGNFVPKVWISILKMFIFIFAKTYEPHAQIFFFVVQKFKLHVWKRSIYSIFMFSTKHYT